MSKTDPEVAAAGRAMKFDEESEDILAFLAAYPRATGEELDLIDFQESPDALCRRPDGVIVGLEHTRICRSPDDAHWEAILDYRDEMDAEDKLEEIERGWPTFRASAKALIAKCASSGSIRDDRPKLVRSEPYC